MVKYNIIMIFKHGSKNTLDTFKLRYTCITLFRDTRLSLASLPFKGGETRHFEFNNRKQCTTTFCW